MLRTARVVRNTKETQICLELNLDGKGTFEGTTGIGFFDHMLDGFARMAFSTCGWKCRGICRWTAITPSRISGLCSAQP